MTLRAFQNEHLGWCHRIGNRLCRRTRNLESDECAHCVVKYLNSMARFEKFDNTIKDNVVESSDLVPDDNISTGLDELVSIIRSGDGQSTIPVGSRIVIKDTIWEVVDHDTVKVEGKDHTVTLRLFSRNYSERVFSGRDGTNDWDQSTLRSHLNLYFLKTIIPDALEEIILSVCNTNYSAIWHDEQCQCGCGCTKKTLLKNPVTCVDKVWIPSLSQLGLKAPGSEEVDTLEGDILQAFDPSKTATYKQNVVMAEYLGNSITPKTYWTRSSSITENNTGCTYQIDWNGDVVTVEDAYESTGMIIPFITIG